MDHLLLHAQAWWDAQRFDQRAWQVAAWREQKLRHIQLHVAKALGKVVAAYDAGAGATSGTDALARVRDEVLPDVAIYRSQLLNLFPEVDTPPSLAHRKAGVGSRRPSRCSRRCSASVVPVPNWRPTWNLASMERRRPSPSSVRLSRICMPVPKRWPPRSRLIWSARTRHAWKHYWVPRCLRRSLRRVRKVGDRLQSRGGVTNLDLSICAFMFLQQLTGFDHGVGHSLLLLCDVKAPNGQKSNEFNGLGHYLSDASLNDF